MQKIALCYDFDGTLCSGYMQNQKLIPDCNIDIGKFWSEVTQYSRDNKMIQHYLICYFWKIKCIKQI